MKILETQSEVISNYDVLKHINDVQAEYARRDAQGNARTMPANLAAILKDTKLYLTLPSQPFSKPTAYSDDAFKQLFDQLPLFAQKSLTQPEILMIVNHRPTDVPSLEVLIEEADSRYSSEQLGEIVGAVVGCFGGKKG